MKLKMEEVETASKFKMEQVEDKSSLRVQNIQTPLKSLRNISEEKEKLRDELD